ncbi:MAG: hypothetical protein NWQ23_03520 [Yoonia sp.]|uniref:hypothetical protein n=1 Tax=Yoonia sp. TaxID=2212373 RepID=UPI00273D73BA|nr:hypothetical protein [Yoonia sp.]MDP5084465.1 hypothetical protein [Yoonia sp.]MDP5359741.1 hypothetical protein [Paracoccaceae bacterium]
MPRIFLALVAAAIVSAAAPASALSFQVDFPTLTYPPRPAPEVSQGCTDMTTLNGAPCKTSSK